MSAFLD